jgi:cell division septation protein DedD
LIGIALSFFVYLREILPYTVQQPPAQATVPPAATPTAPAPAASASNASSPTAATPAALAESGVVAASAEDEATTARNGPRFEFYDVLPEQEVKVSNRPAAATNDTPPGADPELQTEVDRPITTQPVTAPGTYVLQVGSFRDLREAEGLKAHLALLGISAHIERATLSGNDVWHRVRLGPFNDLGRLNQTRSQLAQNNITSMVLQF